MFIQDHLPKMKASAIVTRLIGVLLMAFARTGFHSAATHIVAAFFPTLNKLAPSLARQRSVLGNLRQGRRSLWYAAPALLVLLSSGMSWAAYSLGFGGVAKALSVGSITLASPAGIAVDAAGNIFVVDTGNSRIVELNAQGTASVLSINGLSPSLSSPEGIAVDGSGNLYIADTGNNRVVKVSSDGEGSVISTGSVTLSSPRGIALDQSGNIFIADTGHNQIVEVTSGGTASALAITVSSGPAGFSSPIGLAVDVSGKLYIADSANNRIVTVAAGSTTGTVVTIAGGVTVTNPTGVAVDNIGNLYVTDTNRIAEVDTAGYGDVLATNKPVSIGLSAPKAVAVDVFGTVYVADTGNHRVVAAAPRINTNIAPGDPSYSLNKTAVGFGHVQLGSSTPASLTLNFSIAFTPALGEIKVLTSGVPNLDFTATTGASNCTSGDAGTACNVYVQFLPTAPGLRTGAVVLYDDANPSRPMLTIPLYGWGDAPVAALAPNTGSVINTGALPTNNPYQIALDGAGNFYVGNYTGMNVTKVAAGGGSAAVVNLGTPGGTATQNLTGVALDGAGNLFIGDHQRSRIIVVTPGGVVSVLNINGLTPALGFPTALVFDGAGNLYIADFTNGRIVEVSSLVVAGTTATGKGTVLRTGAFSFAGSTLTGAAVDPQGTVYFAARTQNGSSIVKVTATGVASVVAIPNNITPTISNPQGVGVDAMGNLYIVDTGHNRIVKITTAGVGSVLSISGLPSPSSLGSLLFGVTVDPAGNLYISDWSNNRIVFVNVSGATQTFASTKVGLTSTDSPKTATVTNLGNQPLAFSANPTYTADFSENSSDTNLCTSSTTLSSGTECDVSVKFTPQSLGSLSTNITATNNTQNVGGSTQQIAVSGTATNPGDTTSTTVAITPTSLANGQMATITATVRDTTSGRTAILPTGNVILIDSVGPTTLNGGSAVALNGGTAILNNVLLHGLGTHTITANYAGVSGSFMTSSGTASVAVSKASVAVTGPATPPSITGGQSGSVTVTLTSPYTTIDAPSGSVTYSILNASNASQASGTAVLTPGSGSSTATISIPGSLAAGSYTLSISYAGDANYLATSAAANVALQIVPGDFALTPSNPGDTNPTSNTPVTVTETAGAATVTMTFNPANGAQTFPEEVHFNVTGLPVGSTWTVTPNPLPAGSSVNTPVVLTIQLPHSMAGLTRGHRLLFGLSPVMAGILLLPFGGWMRRKLGQGRQLVISLCALLVVAGALGLTGCGAGDSGYFGQRNIVATLTASTASGLSHSTNFTIIVK